MKKLTFTLDGGTWVTVTRYGRMHLCHNVMKRLFPSLNSRPDSRQTILISSTPQEGFHQVELKRPDFSGYWQWDVLDCPLPDTITSMNYFGHCEETTTAFLAALKHVTIDKLANKVTVWVGLQE